MAKAGSIQAITGSVLAHNSQGQVRELNVGDIVYENEIIETPAGTHVTILLDNGNVINLSELSTVLLDETVTDKVDAYNAMVHEVEMLQELIESGEDIEDAEIETAMGEADDGFEYDDDYYGGDTTRGEVGTRLLDAGGDQELPPTGPPAGTDPDTDPDATTGSTAAGGSGVGSGGTAPVAVDDTISATEDTPFTSTIDLDTNDTDIDGDALAVVPGTFATVQGGTLVVAADGSYTYTPAANFNGTDTVDYTVTDGTLTDTGTLTITVGAVNDAATVSTASQTLAETDAALTASGTLTATDVDNPDDTFTPETIVGTIGTLSIDA
ncbi:MAG: retention module-containing protein, partial [Desulfobacterales bacterium]|nr:retention module-containing protein [Desulfobacterales bacterium]